MKDVDIVVFNDKSWVRFIEYQKVKEECEQLQQKWLESEYEKSKLVSQNEKLRCCANCTHGKQADCDEYPVAACLSPASECSLESFTRNSAGKYHDWNDKCDKWEVAK